MLCPLDQTELVMSERQGIEIDYCPKCRGVWLDRGELDKIIERSAEAPATTAQAAPPPPARTSGGHREQREYRERSDHDAYRDQDYRRRKKRGSFLEDIFDF